MASSFASLIKDLSSAAPAELDPENAYHSIDATANKLGQHATEYRAVSPSRLRNELPIDEDTSKYSGRRVTRKQLQDNDSDQSDTDQDEASDTHSSAELEEASRKFGDGDNESSHTGSSDQPHSESELLKYGPRPGAGTGSTSRAPDDDSDAGDAVGTEATSLVKQLQASAKADISKGKAIKAQLVSTISILSCMFVS